jgi:hypothetical protein
MPVTIAFAGPAEQPFALKDARQQVHDLLETRAAARPVDLLPASA